MADKKTGKSTASHKKTVKEFQKEGNPDFQKSGSSDFQPRASDVFQEKTGASQKPSASKSHAKKEYRETFGQMSRSPVPIRDRRKRRHLPKLRTRFPDRIIPVRRRKTGKGRKKKRITTAGTITGSHRKRANTTKSVCSESINTGKKPKIPFLRKMPERSLRRIVLRSLPEAIN